MAQQSFDRTKFNNAFLTEIARPRQYRYRPRKTVWVGAFGLVLLITSGATGVLGFGMFDSERSSLKQGATLLATCMIKGDCERLLALFPESEQGRALVASGNAELFGDGGQAHATTGTTEQRMTDLQEKRAALEDLGLSWKTAKPIGIGGVRARVAQPGQMNGSAAAFTGYLYFESDARLYALEVCARLCDGHWVFIDLTSTRFVPVDPENAKEDSHLVFEAYRDEPDHSNDGVRISGARHIFIPLN